MDAEGILWAIRMMREGSVLHFSTHEKPGVIFGIGQRRAYGLWWTTVYSVNGAVNTPVKGYKDKLIDEPVMEDWLAGLDYHTYTLRK